MKKKTENGREYITANGMCLKTKNSKESWAGADKKVPEILHVTRRGQYWLECYCEKTFQAIAKHLDLLDAEAWKENQRKIASDLRDEAGKCSVVFHESQRKCGFYKFCLGADSCEHFNRIDGENICTRPEDKDVN